MELQWKVHTTSWLKEIADQQVMAYQRPCFRIYEFSDPDSPHFNQEVTNNMIENKLKSTEI